MFYRVHYSAPRDITSPGLDGKKFSFPVTYVPKEYVGAPDEKLHTKQVAVVVSMSGTIIAMWQLTDEAWIRVLFEFTRRFFKDELAKNRDLSSGKIEMPMIVSRTHQQGCPFDSSRIPNPDGFSEDIEIQKRMGFGAT